MYTCTLLYAYNIQAPPKTYKIVTNTCTARSMLEIMNVFKKGRVRALIMIYNSLTMADESLRAKVEPKHGRYMEWGAFLDVLDVGVSP